MIRTSDKLSPTVLWGGNVSEAKRFHRILKKYTYRVYTLPAWMNKRYNERDVPNSS